MSENGEPEPLPTLEWATPTCVEAPDQYGVVGEVPSKRSGHTLTIAGTNAFLFGGCTASKPPGPTNDMFVLKISGTEFEWARVETPDDGPAPR
jgi:dynein heavy chain